MPRYINLHFTYLLTYLLVSVIEMCAVFICASDVSDDDNDTRHGVSLYDSARPQRASSRRWNSHAAVASSTVTRISRPSRPRANVGAGCRPATDDHLQRGTVAAAAVDHDSRHPSSPFSWPARTAAERACRSQTGWIRRCPNAQLPVRATRRRCQRHLRCSDDYR